MVTVTTSGSASATSTVSGSTHGWEFSSWDSISEENLSSAPASSATDSSGSAMAYWSKVRTQQTAALGIPSTDLSNSSIYSLPRGFLGAGWSQSNTEGDEKSLSKPVDDVVLGDQWKISGNVTFTNGNVVEGVTITAIGNDETGSFIIETTETDSNGHYEIVARTGLEVHVTAEYIDPDTGQRYHSRSLPFLSEGTIIVTSGDANATSSVTGTIV